MGRRLKVIKVVTSIPKQGLSAGDLFPHLENIDDSVNMVMEWIEKTYV